VTSTTCKRSALALAAFALLSAPALAETVPWKATMTGADVVPPVEGTAKGQMDASYDTISKELRWTITFSGLSGPATAIHLHGPAAPGKTAPELVPVAGPYTSPIKGSATLTPEQADTLKRGVYVDIHTAAHPDGEVRGELK
jgi:hypothetical protein